jgi:hypothetical protein
VRFFQSPFQHQFYLIGTLIGTQLIATGENQEGKGEEEMVSGLNI